MSPPGALFPRRLPTVDPSSLEDGVEVVVVVVVLVLVVVVVLVLVLVVVVLVVVVVLRARRARRRVPDIDSCIHSMPCRGQTDKTPARPNDKNRRYHTR